ncbi:hypothetical protein BCU68_15595 [Vibrio sp. 10N.286.49.B3]|uniref:alkaline phosphatase n=1 Tax=Vibrio sp. 10N.286.49.B3 TaxID=1880855 RepID=UPI000C82018C|nr:alkaline phosphatase [Vibrio sp. 10N.286.49.B3]PMH41383.1 hypothetical protein BCU68_15595 [Vibrio sp. 10N.286.49.B3]
MINNNLKFGLISIAIASALVGCNSSNDSDVEQGTQVKNIIVMINDGASAFTWDMATYWSDGKKTNDTNLYSDMDVFLGMSTYPLNTASDATFDDISTVNYDKNKAWETILSDEVQDKDGYEAYIKGYQYLRDNYTDSAASGTAIATGTKTYNNSIGFDNYEKQLPNITQIAKQNGFATGVVSSVQVSHATPATFSAHNLSRRDQEAISIDQFTNNYVDLLMGVGHPDYDDVGQNMAFMEANDPDGCSAYWACNTRYNNIDKEIWIALNKGEQTREGYDKPNRLITDKTQFELLAENNLDFDPSQPLIGIPKVRNTLQASRPVEMGFDPNMPSGVAQLQSVPSLETMTKAALNYLGAKDTGIFLMVEGGATDWAAHDHQQGHHKVNYLIEETHDFNQSVAAVKEWVEENSSWEETLLIVTTDHGNAMPLSMLSDLPEYAYDTVENFGLGNPALDGVNVKFWSTQHTNELVRLWAKGSPSKELNNHIVDKDENFAKFIGHNSDGAYIDNTHIFDAIKAIIE